MSDALTQLQELFEEYPFIRGTLAYAITYPASSIIQEYLEHGKTLANADWGRALRFCIFGAVFMSPLYYYWLKVTYPYFKENDLSTAVLRAVFEQVTFGPFCLLYFFFIMSLLEMQSLKTCLKEVREKFWPTFKAGCLFWPVAQTINFYCLSENNRLVFKSIVSFMWVLYMGHMQSKKHGRVRRARRTRRSD